MISYTENVRTRFIEYEPVEFIEPFTVTRNLWRIKLHDYHPAAEAAFHVVRIIVATVPALIADAIILLTVKVIYPASVYLFKAAVKVLKKWLIIAFAAFWDMIKYPVQRALTYIAFAVFVLIIYILYDTGRWKDFYELFSTLLHRFLSLVQ